MKWWPRCGYAAGDDLQMAITSKYVKCRCRWPRQGSPGQAASSTVDAAKNQTADTSGRGARSTDGSRSHQSHQSHQSWSRSRRWSWSRCCSAFVACASGCTQWQTVASVNCSTKLCSISCTSSQSCQLLNQPPSSLPPPLLSLMSRCLLQLQFVPGKCNSWVKFAFYKILKQNKVSFIVATVRVWPRVYACVWASVCVSQCVCQLVDSLTVIVMSLDQFKMLSPLTNLFWSLNRLKKCL